MSTSRYTSARPGGCRLPCRCLSRAAVVLVFALFTASCGRDPEPVELELADLVRFADSYEGRRVATSGLVRYVEHPEHYWIEDDELNRVQVRPGSGVSPHVGERIRVVGVFEYSPASGRSIRAARISVIDQ